MLSKAIHGSLEAPATEHNFTLGGQGTNEQVKSPARMSQWAEA